LRHGVPHHLRGHYPSFIAHTGSCARPNPSRRLWINLLRPVFAGSRQSLRGDGRSRRYLCESFSTCKDPLPRRLLWCTHPFLPTRPRPSRRCHPVGAFAMIHALATSAWGTFRGCSHSFIFKPVDLLATPVAPTLTPPGIRWPWLLPPRLSQFVTSLSRGYANRLDRAIGGRGTSTLQDSQPCRLLRHPSPQNRLAYATAIGPRPPCVRRRTRLPPGPTAPANGSTACRMRLHTACGSFGTSSPFAPAGRTPAPTPSADVRHDVARVFIREI
jgi:hypothetical protein